MLLLIEFVMCLIIVVTSFLVPDLGQDLFSKVEPAVNRLARRRRLAVLTVGVLALVVRAALLSVEPIPLPQVHDEFSYLLMADTFAHGRLANPTHAMWVHFETFHVNQRPRYVSIYYPAQGLFLAVGQLLFGHPFWGVWLSIAVMCAAICWMLQAWVSPFWALIGGVLAIIRLGTFSYWANSYWGGSVAAIGGALVLGGLLRVRKQYRSRDAVVMALGFVILANSRPFEGLFFSIPVLVYFAIDFRRRFPLRVLAHNVILPLCLVLGLGASGMLYYFWRTTGSVFVTPYSLNLRTYIPVPFFPWQNIRAIPEYHHAAMKDLYLGWWQYRYEFARTHPLLLIFTKALFLWKFFLGFILLLPLLLAPFVRGTSFLGRDSFKKGMLLCTILCGVLALLLPVYILPHYAAPWTGALYLFIMLSMQRIRKWKRQGKRPGVAVLRFSLLGCLALLVARSGAEVLRLPVPAGLPSWCSRQEEIPGRAEVLARLSERSSCLLVLVRYRVPRDFALAHFDWVYNGADIDGSKIVWARDMGREQNRELLDYFRDREVWLVEPDERPVRLSLYRTVPPRPVNGSIESSNKVESPPEKP